MPPTSVTELQQKLYKRMGFVSTAPDRDTPSSSHVRLGQVRQSSRKELRKQQRATKKRKRRSDPCENGKRCRRMPSEPQIVEEVLPALGSNLEAYSKHREQDADLEESGTDITPEDDTDELESYHSLDESDNISQGQTDGRRVSEILLKQLAQDDAEIENLERKLGIKKIRQSLPQAFKKDGLDELLDEAVEGDVADSVDKGEQKAAYDSWLSSKRKKLGGPPPRVLSTNISVASDRLRDPGMKQYRHDARLQQNVTPNGAQLESQHDLTQNEDQASKGFDHIKTLASPPFSSRPRENPYVAPIGGLAKYIAPSRSYQDEEAEAKDRTHLQKKLQGVVNRLSDGNFISLAQSIDSMYQVHARGKVTEILTDTILAQIRKPESLNDQFLVLIGGFSAAIYRIKGSSFGSHLVRQLLKEFSEQYALSSDQTVNHAGMRKEPSNLLAFFTQLYVFEILGCGIVFDYLERLLEKLNELNVELLLRVCRMAGKLLRRDDPQALKHISNVLHAAVSNFGYLNISVRTKFMIETIQDLNNSKAKGKGMDSAIVCEHVIRTKKRLGELKSHYQRLEGLIPMGIRLKDIESVGRHGKWWLVGASVPEYRNTAEMTNRDSDQANGRFANEDMDFVLPDFMEKAKAQGLNTSSQIAIFTAIMSALDYEHAHRQFADLRLKRDEQLEITRVLLQCVGSELQYNEYYALVGRQACANSRVRFSFQNRLWAMFRGLGESLFGAEAEKEEAMEGQRLKNDRRLRNVAQFYASLVADGYLSITILKPLELSKMNPWSSTFVECFVLSLLRGCRGRNSTRVDKIKRIFGSATEIPPLAADLHWYLKQKIRHAPNIGHGERKSLHGVLEKAQATVQIVKSKNIL
ncbi:hypothetical protein E4U61_007525 [Claviceps capensis]|nr:hypothetical protein E4U61_007525 [Claviceps capensis]